MQKALRKWRTMPDQVPDGRAICRRIEAWRRSNSRELCVMHSLHNAPFTNAGRFGVRAGDLT